MGNITIGFVIALKPKFNSKNWKNDSKLLYQTLESICNQESEDFMAFVVYHDLPDIVFNHKKIHYLKFPFSFCIFESLDKIKAEHRETPEGTTYFFDQGKKIMYGAEIAKFHNCRYIMSVDFDDLISNRILKYITEDDNRSGYYVEKGYIYYTEKKLLLRRKKRMNGINGSTNIIYHQNISNVDLFSNDVDSFSFFSAHYYTKFRLLEQGIVIKPLPFYAIVYRAHISNWFNIHTHMNGFSLKVIYKYLFQRHFITKAIKKEFRL